MIFVKMQFVFCKKVFYVGQMQASLDVLLPEGMGTLGWPFLRTLSSMQQRKKKRYCKFLGILPP